MPINQAIEIALAAEIKRKCIDPYQKPLQVKK